MEEPVTAHHKLAHRKQGYEEAVDEAGRDDCRPEDLLVEVFLAADVGYELHPRHEVARLTFFV